MMITEVIHFDVYAGVFQLLDVCNQESVFRPKAIPRRLNLHQPDK